MANHASALKRVRQDRKKAMHNKYYHKTMRNALRAFKTLDDKKQIAKSESSLVSMIDKLSKRGIIHKNKAANLKSKISKKINSL